MLIHRDLPYSGQKTGVRLQPENHTMSPIIVDRANVRGRLVALIRRF